MLERLEISDFALIAKANLSLDPGFNCISGETGAGKSLLMGAISAITGKQVSKDLIREGQEEARVEAIYTGVEDLLRENPDFADLIEEDNPDEIILSRELRRNSRNTCRINGRLASLSLLKEIGTSLADIHGQNDKQQIFNKSKHLGLLDSYGHTLIDPKKELYQESYQALNKIRKAEKLLLADPEERKLVLARLDYQINEIETISPKKDEDEKLRQERAVLQNKDRLKQALATALNHLSSYDEESGALNELDEVLGALDSISSLDDSYNDEIVKLNEISYSLRDIQSKLEDDLEYINNQENNLEAVVSRLDKITRLKKKYNGSIEGIWKYYEEAKNKKEDLLNTENKVGLIQKKKEKVINILAKRAKDLKAARMETAKEMEAGINRELSDLGMENAKFKVKFTDIPLEKAKAQGTEEVEFLLKANSGSKFLPLAKTASGGEASRIMLAIKVILAKADNLQLLVFDEIDSGISGKTTTKVAEKLKDLAKSHQIICVTHQAQIAAVADKHFYIYKEDDGNTTETLIKELDQEERVDEIARLLSGDTNDQSSRKLAKELLEADA